MAQIVYLTILITFLTSIQLLAQSVGDYRSNGTGDWDALSTWQRYNGTTWETPTGAQGFPGEFSSSSSASVTVRTNVTLNTSPDFTIGNLDIIDESTLATSGNPNLSIAGNFQIVSDWWFIFPLPSSCSFGNGDLIIGGGLTIEASGTLTFGTGNLSVTGATTIDLGATLINNGNFTTPSTITINSFILVGEFENYGSAFLTNTGTGVLDGDGIWTQGPNSSLNYSGSTLTIGTLNASSTGNTVNYNRNGAQTLDAPSGNTYYHLTLSGSGVKPSSDNLNIDGNLLISGTSQLDVDSGNDNINIAGNWTVTSSNGDPFLQGTESVTFDGSSAQTITSNGTETFYRLTTNNSFGASPQITLNGNVTVTNTLTMQDGNVNLNGNTFTVGTSAASTGALSHAGASTNGWMYGGNLVRYMATTATTIGGSDQNEGFFPLGSSADFRPFFVGKSNTGSSGGAVTVSHTNATTTSDVSFADTNPVATITRRHDAYWTVATSGISAGTWSLRAGGTNFGTVQEAADLRMSTSSGVVGTNSTGTGGPTDYRVNRTGLTYGQLSNNFHVASTDASNSPLPIELMSFTAKLKNSVVELKWSTASETDNDYFTIERASDVEHFEAIIEEDGRGTTKELHKYQVVDSSPLYGRSYYRLRQTDFDGKFSYSPLQVIDYEGPKYVTLTAFPNPLRESDLTIRIEGLTEVAVVPVQILNMQGQTVYENLIDVKTPGIITEEIPASYFLNSGLYIIKAGETLYMTQKLVVE